MKLTSPKMMVFIPLLVSFFSLEAAISSVQTNALALQSNGQVVSADSLFAASTSELLTIRYNADGSFDSSFGSSQNGIVTQLVGSLTIATSIGIQSTGDIISGGYAVVSGVPQFMAIAYDSTGALDTSFGADGTGIVTQMLGSASASYAMVIQSDDSVVQAGIAVVSGTPQFGISRLTSAGLVDSSFGSGGIVTTPIGSEAVAQALALQSNGQIVAAGWTLLSGAQAGALARYNTDGSLDTSFGSSGTVAQQLGTGSSQIYAVAIDASQNIVVAGSADTNFMVARFTSTGALDSTFGTGGIVTTAIPNGVVKAVLIQSNGDIVAVGNSGTNNIAVARYTSTGSLDSTFGTGGILIPAIPLPAQANTAILRSGGNILAGGTVGPNSFLIGFTSTGGIDTTWGINGIVYMPGVDFLYQTTLILDQKAQGTNGGTFTSGSWQTRNLTTVINGSANISLLNNQIILQPGVYIVEAFAPAYKVGSHQIRLQNITLGTTIAYGTSAIANAASSVASTSSVKTVVFAPQTITLELQHQCQTTESSDGFGLAANFGPETYSNFVVSQIA